MTLPTLDQSVQDQLNHLVLPDDGNRISYTFKQYIQWRGTIQIVTYHLLKQAQELIPHQMSLEEFVEHYQLEFGASPNPLYPETNFHGSLSPIKKDGIFLSIMKTEVSQQKYHNLISNDYMYYFDPDSLNNFFFIPHNTEKYNLVYKEEMANGKYLCDKHVWSPQDLTNPEILAKSLKLAKNIWYISKTLIDDYTKEDSKLLSENPLPPETLTLFNKLIDYYQALMER